MQNVVVLTLSDEPSCATPPAPRVPVRQCADALTAAGVSAELVTAGSDEEVDAALKPIETGEARLIVAAATDGQLRAVLRRFVRRYAPAPSKRPSDLPADRTVPDLPPIGVLPLLPAVPELVRSLELPQEPAQVAAATVSGRERRLDLLRQDSGSVTLHSALIGGADEAGRPVPWRGRVEVDDAVLTTGDDPVLACAITNVGGSRLDGLPLLDAARADDGLLHVAIAVPVLARRLLRRPTLRFEVRRAHGRAVSVTPQPAGSSGEDDLPLVDDGVVLELNRKRSWWVERSAWSVYVP